MRVSGAVRALYSLPGDLYVKLSLMVLEFQNTLYFVKIPFIYILGVRDPFRLFNFYRVIANVHTG